MFLLNDLGDVKCCVGLRITRNREQGEIYIDKSVYIEDILKRFKMIDSKPISTPFDINTKLTTPTHKSPDFDNIPYQEAIGSLLYLVQGTRPDIAFAVNHLSKFNNNFDNSHWTAVKRIFRYIKGTMNVKLCFSKIENPNIFGFCDADYAGDVTDRRSCTGYVFMQQGAISWCSKRQATIALSTTEAEYMAMSAAVQEAEWLRQLQNDLWNSEKI
ncbi:secreted RxLR effector protein 161-like [Lucilia sericata]|uniref:secreted RxLR effector protein 161-like n=1 Tax=Lucilia sericata TaxID=13632 RepID=UPI0018A7F5F8|nr:secreted RxLR effector protein 161-like [Lucilia sericata]